MKKLNQQQSEVLENLKRSIQNLQLAQNNLYTIIVETLEYDNDFIHDYVFNCDDESEYTKFVREKIYGI